MAETGATREVRVRVPAKVNLFLAVRGVRPDGYHELTTVLQTVGVYDELRVRLHGTPWARQHPAARKLMRVELSHDAGDAVPDDADNLVLRAARELQCALWTNPDEAAGEASDGRAPLTTIELAKSIPVAAGMAGGSADAAAALLALDRLWGAQLERRELHSVASRVGADVPFCLDGGTALATGTGADTVRVLARGQFHWVVGVAADGGLSTPDVYAAYDALDRPPSVVEPDVVLQALRTGDVELLANGLHNDLQPAAVSLRPRLADDLAALEDAGALRAVVSGSGPTVVGLVPDREHGEAVAEAVAGRFARVELVSSPGGGPRIAERLLEPA